MSDTQQFKGQKPIRRTVITSGSGTYVPLMDDSLCYFELVAGGAAGNRPAGATQIGGGGGGAGGTRERWVRVPIAGFAYIIGAGGVIGLGQGTAGGDSRFGNFVARGGSPSGAPLTGGGVGGAVGNGLSTDAMGAGTPGGAGGAGGGAGQAGQRGGAPGFQQPGSGTGLAAGGAANADGGGGAGGDSTAGIGGTGGRVPSPAAGAATGYGSGGGGGGANGVGAGGDPSAGQGGRLLVWEYGA